MSSLNLVGASIDELQAALTSGALSSVELVALYLRRVAHYDCRGPELNAIPILNQRCFDEAAASDDWRASGNRIRPLEGIPYTVKDSYKVKGMTVASGSPAFKDLVANEDAFTVSKIRDAGGVLIGRTNMPPMAYGGMQRGVYGRAESPYNPKYLAAAWASGSSNGSAVSTAASMAAFGMAEETVSSGRSPASNNALVAYTPSRGFISIRGNWPLYPTCDVIVPHAKTMKDLLRILEVITAEDTSTVGDFWRDQPYFELPKQPWVTAAAAAGKGTPEELFRDISQSSPSLAGLRIAVPQMYVGGPVPDGGNPVFTSDEVLLLWQNAQKELEAMGAEIVVVPDFPAITAYEHPHLLPKGAARLPENWGWYERGPLVAHGWEQFLCNNADPTIPGLSAVDEFNIFPNSMRTAVEMKHVPPSNSIHWGKLAKYVQDNPSIYDTDNLKEALFALEAMRVQLVDGYLKQHRCDMLVFPCQGDVAREDSDTNPDSAEHAWKNGIWYSHGNRAFRHLGIPSVTVPMGIMSGKNMPVGLTFAGPAFDDCNLLRWANAFERKTQLRQEPPYTPALKSDVIHLGQTRSRKDRPTLRVEITAVEDMARGVSDTMTVSIRGSVQIKRADEEALVCPVVEIVVDGIDIMSDEILITKTDDLIHSFEAKVRLNPPVRNRGDRRTTYTRVAKDKTMVVVLARADEHGYPAGYLELI
ncbi:hypothetical protein SBRCBS47491_008558 [Sporothrix bragantina]|uniref:Amidase domain-containing protein n=1 Tax=Sporothrix bragantina TaxID=671064 RepID=A0ABP0CMF6_9PEZI